MDNRPTADDEELGGEVTTDESGDTSPKEAVAGVESDGIRRPEEPESMETEEEEMQDSTTGSPATISVALGETLLDEDSVNWEPSIKGSPHMFVLGIPGQGKTWTVTRILTELAHQGLPALVMDFHGQFARQDGRFAQVADPIVMDAAEGLPFSPFEADAGKGASASSWKTNCLAVADIFEYVCGLGDMQRDVVFTSLKSCYEDLGFADGSNTRYPTLSEFSEKLSSREKETGVRNVVARCRPLLEFDLFTDSPASESPLSTIFDRGVVLDVHSLGVETLQLAAGAFLLRKIYKDMVRWGEAERLRLAIVLDEAHRLAKDMTLPKIMKEGRKFGVVVLVASQGLADYHPDVVGNAGTKVVFRTNHPQSKKVAGFLKAPKGQDVTGQIEELKTGQAFVQTPEMKWAERLRMYPPTSPDS